MGSLGDRVPVVFRVPPTFVVRIHGRASPLVAAVELPVQPALLPQTLNLVAPFVILLVGWLVAGLAQRVVRSLLRRTRVDEMISSAVTPADGQGEPLIRLDRTIAAVTFWVILNSGGGRHTEPPGPHCCF